MKKTQTNRTSASESGKTRRNAGEKALTPSTHAAAQMQVSESRRRGKSGMENKPSAGPKVAATAGQPASKKQAPEPMGIKKESKPGKKSMVTFRLPAQAAPKASKVTVVGDFNNWSREATPLRRLENGDFAVTIELDSGKEYRFRYLIDGTHWENDWRADKYVKSPYGADDSVVAV